MSTIAYVIAGSEATGGAGLQADLKTFERLGVYGVGTITCIVSFDPKSNWGHRFVPVASQVSVALVVGHDEDDVGSRRAKSGEEQGAGGEEEQAQGGEMVRR